MRIVYLHQYFRPPESGGGIRSYEFARRWVEAGHDVHVVAADHTRNGGWRTETVDGVVVHSTGRVPARPQTIPQRLANYTAYGVVAAPKARSLKPDVVYATSTPLTVAIPAWAAGAPYVLEVRDMWPDVPIAMGYLANPAARRAAELLEQQAYARAAHIVTLAPGMREDIIAKGFPESKVTTVTQGCDTYLFDRFDPSDIRRENPWLGDRPVILYVGAFGTSHGVGYAVDLAAAARDAGKDWQFVIIGRGPQEEQIRERARSEGLLGDNFHMLGFLPKAEAAKWFKGATLSLALGDGPAELTRNSANNKFFDALAAGVPTANNFASYQTNLCEQLGVGFEIPKDDLTKAVGIMSDYLADDAWMTSVAPNCRDLATGRFNRDALAAQALQILEQAAY